MINNKFGFQKLEQRKNDFMPEEKVDAPNATETVVVSETDKGVEVSGEVNGSEVKVEIEAVPKSTETPKEPVSEEDQEPLDVESMRKTFAKLRSEIKELKGEVNTTKSEKDRLASELQLKSDREAEEKGEWKEVAESRQTQLSETSNKLKDLEIKYNTTIENSEKKFKEQEKAIHKIINLQIEKWPEIAKSRIDSEKEKSGAERIEQLERVAPLVEEMLKSAVTPGLFPSPRDARESGGEQNLLDKQRIREKVKGYINL